VVPTSAPGRIEVGVSSRRTLILIAAIVVGALAAFAIFNYVGGIEDRAYDNAERVPVIRVAQDIPRGLDGATAQSEGYFEQAEIPEEFMPATAVTDLDTILAKIAVTDLAANQVLVEGMFVDPVDSLITAARRIPTGQVAITMSVDNVRGVGGLIVPGDFVNMMLVPPGCQEQAAEGEEEAQEPTDATAINTAPLPVCARYLYQAVRVLFVGQTPVPLPGEATAPAATGGGGALTLAVPSAAAQVLASLPEGQVYLTLLPADYTPEPLPAQPPLEVFPGEDGLLLTPYGPEGFEADTP
jgi:Flp pilus assembly protein CpaB